MYQSGAVTTLPPLQESRPEILGFSEEGGVFLAKTSLAFPSGFFYRMVRPLVLLERDGAKRGAKFFLNSETTSAPEGGGSMIGLVTNFIVSLLMVLVTVAFLPGCTHMCHIE